MVITQRRVDAIHKFFEAPATAHIRRSDCMLANKLILIISVDAKIPTIFHFHYRASAKTSETCVDEEEFSTITAEL